MKNDDFSVCQDCTRREGPGPRRESGPDRFLAVRIRSSQRILTLVGGGIDKRASEKKVSALLHGITCFVIPTLESLCSIRIAVPQAQIKNTLEAVHEAFLSARDQRVFAARSHAGKQEQPPEAALPRGADRSLELHAAARYFPTELRPERRPD